ncbi:BlaI/MecI/CopY family transcriptional regulator [Embleya sp. NPDC001921]
MDESPRVQGELQAEIMSVLWRIEAGTVERIRSELAEPSRGAYTTVQTVCNRLTERGLLARAREGQAFVYRPTVTEADYVASSVSSALAAASAPARRVALAQLVGGLKVSELEDLRELARRIEHERGGR